ncbi:MAG: hypothetical protein EPO35_08615 [Acidobacteria bacterium]|nr:MAG: hypothetical protein EPO35_08615 [Acidobacteriota bacterium]
MTTALPVLDFTRVWQEFLQSIEGLLQAPVPQEDRFRHFRPWSQSVIGVLLREDHLDDLTRAWTALERDPNHADARNLVLMEMEAFNQHVEPTLQAIDSWRKRPQPAAAPEVTESAKENLGIAKIILDSVKDMFENLPASLKILLKSLGEVVEIGKELL